MDIEEFRIHGKEMVDFVADYWRDMRKREPLPNVKPGYMSNVIPRRLPSKTDDWKTIFDSLEEVVLKGNTNWNHPLFFAYYPAACSYPAILSDILNNGVNSAGFDWKSSPSFTELEMKTLDWLVDLLGLPTYFKNSDPGQGCGITQTTATESTMLAVMYARARVVDMIKNNPAALPACGGLKKTVRQLLEDVRRTVEEEDPAVITSPYHDPIVFRRLIAYFTDQAHYSVEKVAAFCGVKFRKLRTILDPILKNYSVTKETLETAIREDRARGLIPFFMLATLGTTATCAVDSLRELGPICNREFIYLHADAAYGGGFLVCPEFRYLSNGIEYADSFNFNGHKEFQALFFSPMWFKDGVTAMKYFKIGNEVSEEWEETPAAIQHLRVPSGRRANALKIYFVLRSLGFEYIQSELRKHVQLAALFARLITGDDDFELFVPQHLGLVCFRIKNGTNAENKALCQAINDDRRIHLVPGEVHGVYFLRFAVCSPLTTEDDVRFAYNICKELLAKLNINDIFPANKTG